MPPKIGPPMAFVINIGLNRKQYDSRFNIRPSPLSLKYLHSLYSVFAPSSKASPQSHNMGAILPFPPFLLSSFTYNSPSSSSFHTPNTPIRAAITEKTCPFYQF